MMEATGDWRDGFLFVGNALSLDFLNTKLVADGVEMELLPDAAAVGRWLRAAGVESAVGPLADLEGLLEFRERWRGVVAGMERGETVDAEFVTALNELLMRHPFAEGVVGETAGLRRERRYLGDAWGAVLESVVRVLTEVDRSRVRRCGNCVVHFHDTSKKGTRRWCSMNLCGNRLKVAAYARRRREGVAG